MNKTVAALGISVLAILVISCGGDDGAKTFSATASTVQNLQRLSFLSMANSGFGVTNFGPGAGAGETIVPSIGGFIRHFGGPNGTGPAMLKRALLPATAPNTGGESFYYDGSLQLWVATQWSATTFKSIFYFDKSKTRPAGRCVITSESNWSAYPQTYKADYSFTAGTLKGARGACTCTQTSPIDGATTYTGAYADSSRDAGMATWTGTGSKWQSEWDGSNGSGWYKDSGSWSSDKSGSYTCKGSDGGLATWTYKADGSGVSHFEGSSGKLPADLTWTPTGNFKIILPDKTDESWAWSDIWSLGIGAGGSVSAIVSAPAPSVPQKPEGDAKKDAPAGNPPSSGK